MEIIGKTRVSCARPATAQSTLCGGTINSRESYVVQDDKEQHSIATRKGIARSKELRAQALKGNSIMNAFLWRGSAPGRSCKTSAFRLSLWEPPPELTGSERLIFDRTYYEVLGVTPSCSMEELRSAYLELLLLYHPGGARPLRAFLCVVLGM